MELKSFPCKMSPQTEIDDGKVTPYIHLLVKHATDIIANFGSIELFSCQGLERFNDITTSDYFRSTTLGKGVSSLTQLMHRYNRKLYLQTKGVSISKRKYHCSNCHKEGHSKSSFQFPELILI